MNRIQSNSISSTLNTIKELAEQFEKVKSLSSARKSKRRTRYQRLLKLRNELQLIEKVLLEELDKLNLIINLSSLNIKQ